MKTTSLCLLHQEPTALLTTTEMKLKVLVNLSYFIKEAVIALKTFQERKFEKFDPHVGETSCQIRAYMMFLLQSKLRDKNYVSILKKELKKLEALHRLAMQQIVDFQLVLNQKNNRHTSNVFNHEELRAFLQAKHLVFTLSDDAKFLMQSYFLTKFKGKTLAGDSYIDHEKICQEMNISKKLSRKIVHYYQTQLAGNSTDFIFKLLTDLPEYYNLSFTLKKLNFKDDDERSVLPCYLVIKILLQHMIKQECPILIVAKRQYHENEHDTVCLLFEPQQASSDYYLALNIDDNAVMQSYLMYKPCMVIESSVIYKSRQTIESKNQFINRFLSLSLRKIILANMASHPQYSGHKLNPLSYNPYKHLLAEQNTISPKCEEANNHVVYPNLNDQTYAAYQLEEELLEMKHYAEHIGCCENNSSLLFMRHIYCDIVRNQKAHISDFLSYSYTLALNKANTVYIEPIAV